MYIEKYKQTSLMQLESRYSESPYTLFQITF